MKDTKLFSYSIEDNSIPTSFDFSGVDDGALPVGLVGKTGMTISGKLVIDPIVGDELIVDPSIELAYYSGLSQEFTKTGTPTVSQSTSSNSGEYAQSFTGAAINDALSFGYPADSMRWFSFSYYAKRTSGSSGNVKGQFNDGTNNLSVTNAITSSDYSEYVLNGHSVDDSIYFKPVVETGSSSFDTIIIDDISLREFDTESLIVGTKINSISYTISSTINWSGYGSSAGIFIELDDLSNIENYIVVEIVRTSATTVSIFVTKCVDNIGTVEASATGLTYADTMTLKVIRDTNDAFIMYNGAIVIANSFFITNSSFDGDNYVGVFSTSPSITFDNINILESSTDMYYDSYSIAETAPLASPHTCDIGTATIVDTENKFSISGGKLVCSGGKTVPAAGDPKIYTGSFNRQGGLAFYTEINPTLNSKSIRYVGFRTPSTFSTLASFWVHSSGILYAETSLTTSALTLSSYSAGSNIKLCAIIRPTSGAFFCYNVDNAGWKLGYVAITGTTTTLTGVITTYDAAFTADETKVLVLKDEYATDYGLATNRTATVLANDTIEMEANGLVEFTWTAVTGQTLEIQVRRTNDDNCWIIRCDQAASLIKLIQRQGGSNTERDSDSQTFTNGVAYRILIVCDGSTINDYVDGTRKNTYSSATFNQTETGVKVNKAGTDLISWPRSLTFNGIGTSEETSDGSIILLSDTTPEEFLMDETEMVYIEYDGS